MTHLRLLIFALVALGLPCQAQQSALQPQKLKSGRVIFPMQAGPMYAPNMPKEKIFVLSYQTQLLMSDLKALEEEAAEVWAEYRQNFETVPGITMAILQANEMTPSAALIQKGRMYSFVIQRHSNGSWEWLKRETEDSK